MKFGISFVAGRLLTALGLILAAGLLIPGGRAGAEDDAPPTKGTWVFDVRIVRVDTHDPAGVEAAGPFPELSGSTIGLAWSEVLARLKKRGRTAILLDQRITALSGQKCAIEEESTTPILAVNSADDNNTQLRQQVVKTGARFEQTVSGRSMTYRLEYRGHVNPPIDRHAPTQYVVSWSGTHPTLLGPTLVLTHRRQLIRPPGIANLGIEHYGLITGRLLPSR